MGNWLMRMPILIACWLTAAVGSAAAQAPMVSGITITHVGAYAAETKSAPAQSGQESPTGTVGTDTNWHFEADSADVLGKVGTQFGIEFRIDGEPREDGVTLYLTLIFPPQGMHNPNTGKTMHTAKIAFPNMKNRRAARCRLRLRQRVGMVPGVWIEQIWYRDHMLAERSFTVGKVE